MPVLGQYPQWPEEGTGCSGTGATDVCDSPCAGWNWTWLLWHSQLLAAEPSLEFLLLVLWRGDQTQGRVQAAFSVSHHFFSHPLGNKM